MTTRWDLLTEAQRRQLDTTPFGHACTGCGVVLATEGDFARHFIVTDRRWPNLGRCPDATR